MVGGRTAYPLPERTDMECPHGHQVMTCGNCLATKSWPKGHKKCSCARLIPKREALCFKCTVIRREFEVDGTLAHGQVRYRTAQILEASVG